MRTGVQRLFMPARLRQPGKARVPFGRYVSPLGSDDASTDPDMDECRGCVPVMEFSRGGPSAIDTRFFAAAPLLLT